MKRGLFFGFLLICSMFQLFAQESITFNGKQYRIMDINTFAFNHSSENLIAGQRYAINGFLGLISGNTVHLKEKAEGMGGQQVYITMRTPATQALRDAFMVTFFIEVAPEVYNFPLLDGFVDKSEQFYNNLVRNPEQGQLINTDGKTYLYLSINELLEAGGKYGFKKGQLYYTDGILKAFENVYFPRFFKIAHYRTSNELIFSGGLEGVSIGKNIGIYFEIEYNGNNSSCFKVIGVAMLNDSYYQ